MKDFKWFAVRDTLRNTTLSLLRNITLTLSFSSPMGPSARGHDTCAHTHTHTHTHTQSPWPAATLVPV